MTNTTSGISTTTSAAAPLLVNGLVSGINTQSVIQALLQSYSIPITNLQNQQSALNAKASDYQTLNSDMLSLFVASSALNVNNLWNLRAASSSNTAVATATSSPGAQTGSLSFDVTQLAQANTLASTNGVSSTGTVVTSAPSFLVATGGPGIGFSSLAAGSGLALGSHSIQVTQSSQAAALASASAPATTTTITAGTNDTLTATVDGTSYTLTLAPGQYSASGLVSAINAAAATATAPITASLNASGELQVATNEQGSHASLSLGGDALATLNIASGQTVNGSDAHVSVDGVSTMLTSLTANSTVTLASTSGSITATLAAAPGPSGSLISAGTASAALVSSGNGSLSSVVAAINQAGLGVTANAVQESSGAYVLQVGANATGLSGAVTVDNSAFSSGALGGLQTIVQAQDALASVGGASGYEVRSSTDTFSGLLSGTAITAVATGQATVTVSPDASGEAAKVKTMVDAANQALGDIQKYAGYDAATKTAGPLMGSAVVSTLQQQILGMFATVSGTSGLANSKSVGISVGSDGTLSFDEATFESAYSANPTGVASLFTQGGSFSPQTGQSADAVSFVFAGTHTVPGSYDVTVSQSAKQATDAGAVLSSGVTTAAEQLTISEGSKQATYSVASGASLVSIASGLNAAFASSGLSLTASVINNGTQLQLTSAAYGSSVSFSVTSSTAASGATGLGGATAGTAATFTGADVAGTINGVVATGQGQLLSAPTNDPTLQGLAVLVNATGITSSTDLGSLTYSPGLAQQLAGLADGASNVSTGAITTTIQGLQNEASGLNTQISNYQSMETSQQTLLQNEFATMETTLGKLKNESSQLGSAVNGLAGF